MNTKSNGGSAFPVADDRSPIDAHGSPGMSLRDWFAGQAISGFLAHPQDICDPKITARQAYLIADAMLKDREVERS